MVGWLAGGREGDPEAFLFLFSMNAIIMSENKTL